MGTIIEYIIGALIIIAGLAVIIFHLRMLYDSWKYGEFGWLVGIIFFNFVGSVLYYFMKYKNRSPYEKRY